jgi:hypothetical protein
MWQRDAGGRKSEVSGRQGDRPEHGHDEPVKNAMGRGFFYGKLRAARRRGIGHGGEKTGGMRKVDLSPKRGKVTEKGR